MEVFDTNLYPSITRQTYNVKNIQNGGKEGIPYITKNEIRIALTEMKNNRCAGESQIITEMLKL